MKIRIYRDEWFPVYELSETDGKEIEVSDDQLLKWRKVFDDFSAVQYEILDAYKKPDDSKAPNDES